MFLAAVHACATRALGEIPAPELDNTGLQPHSVASVAGQVNFCLIAALGIIMKWPNKRLAAEFVSGFATMGELERTYVLVEKARPATLALEELAAKAREARHSSLGKAPSEMDRDFIFEKGRHS